MKFKDIKPGVIYAYRDSKYGTPEKIMFLAGVEGIRLYAEAPFRAGPEVPAFTASRLDKPESGRSDVWATQSKHGYPAVRRSSWSKEDEPDLTAVTWDDFRQATVGTRYDNDRNIEFTVATRLAAVLGPWDEVMAAEDEKRKAEKAASEKAEAARLDKKTRAAKVSSILQDAGIKAIARSADGYALTIELNEAEKLAGLLGSLLKVDEEYRAGVYDHG